MSALIRHDYSILRNLTAAQNNLPFPLDFGPFATTKSGGCGAQDPRLLGLYLDMLVTASTDVAGDARPDVQWGILTSSSVRDKWGSVVRELSGLHHYLLEHLTGDEPVIGQNLGAGFAGNYRVQIPLHVAPFTPLSSLAEVVASFQLTSGAAVANQVVATAIAARLHMVWADLPGRPWSRQVSTFQAIASSDANDYETPGFLRFAGAWIGALSETAAVRTPWAAGSLISSLPIGLSEMPIEYLQDWYERTVRPRFTAPALVPDETDPVHNGTLIPVYGPEKILAPQVCNLQFRTTQGFAGYSAFLPQFIRQYIEVAGSGCACPGAGPLAPQPIPTAACPPIMSPRAMMVRGRRR